MTHSARAAVWNAAIIPSVIPLEAKKLRRRQARRNLVNSGWEGCSRLLHVVDGGFVGLDQTPRASLAELGLVDRAVAVCAEARRDNWLRAQRHLVRRGAEG